MALIECYECGREISSLAPHCIHCGAPIKAERKQKASERETSPVELTERQREQIESIGATSSKTSTKKKTVKKSQTKKSASKVNKIEGDNGVFQHILRDAAGDAIADYSSTIQWKAVISQAAIIWIVTFILGFLVAWVNKSLILAAIINLTCLITAATLIHYFTKENRFQHCIHVAAACWLTSIINVVFFGIPFVSWLLSAFLYLVCMGIGMLISYLIGLSKNN